MQGVQYCRTECLEMALIEALGQRYIPQSPAVVSHRVPLGLLLLSRQQLTAEQLRRALQAQREEGLHATSGGQRKIGTLLQELGFATEHEITAALARQWACPVLRAAPMAIAASRFPAIPTLLLESFQMMPVGVVDATRTLLMAFSEGIDYTMLYAIEQMLGYRTEACLLSPSTLQKSLRALAQREREVNVIFDRTQDARECAGIIASYTAKVWADEVRMAHCGKHLWIRLERLRQDAITLVLRAPADSSQLQVLSSQ